MTKHISFILTCWVFMVVFIISSPAYAQSKDEVTASMRDRYPALQEAKNNGLVGEAWTGLAALVDQDAPASVQNLVNAENNDRRRLFQIIAQETGTSVEEVARQNRIRMYRLAEDNHFLQDQNRQWVRKRDLNL
ncbi:YdbL family protein [Desulfonatronovibrio hydrogenovorans]|uniref:YdbL family protein n=1 Tax=Desulfonatronovibrio hydrogenovorans TaxID=53245 RepID=UPI00048BB19D|nr:YdbL family protein [Desulfonatronovibrio hydrogenovorans]